MEKLIEIIQQKWLIIWAISALMKWTIQVRNKDFSLMIFFTDMFLWLIIWYVSWELVADKDMHCSLKRIFVTFMSWNAFVFVSILYNPELAKKIFNNFFSKILKDNTK